MDLARHAELFRREITLVWGETFRKTKRAHRPSSRPPRVWASASSPKIKPSGPRHETPQPQSRVWALTANKSIESSLNLSRLSAFGFDHILDHILDHSEPDGGESGTTTAQFISQKQFERNEWQPAEINCRRFRLRQFDSHENTAPSPSAETIRAAPQQSARYSFPPFRRFAQSPR